jgi:hypothetical protein
VRVCAVAVRWRRLRSTGRVGHGAVTGLCLR